MFGTLVCPKSFIVPFKKRVEIHCCGKHVIQKSFWFCSLPRQRRLCFHWRLFVSRIVQKLLNHSSLILDVHPVWAPGFKNGPAPFPGQMSYKATKPGLVSVLYLSMHYMVLLFIKAPFYASLVFVAICSVFWLFWLS